MTRPPPRSTLLPSTTLSRTAQDGCANVSTCVQHITFADTVAPVISCPADKVLASGDSTAPVNTRTPTASDHFRQPVTITFTDAATPANCTGQPGIDRTCKGQDSCANVST